MGTIQRLVQVETTDNERSAILTIKVAPTNVSTYSENSRRLGDV
jgi:hypothetical protein